MEVTLKIYDIVKGVNSITSWLGFGAYHTSLKIQFHEYFYTQEGIQKVIEEENGMLRSRKVIGVFHGAPEAFERILDDLRQSFTPDAYDILQCNCNHFTQALCQSLFGILKIPPYVNRAANVVSFFSNTQRAPVLSHKKENVITCPEDEEMESMVISLHTPSINQSHSSAA